MGTRGETQETERESLTLPPPSNRRVPRRMTSKGEGGVGALEASRDTETGQDRRPPGRRPFREPWRIRGLRRPWRIRGLRRPWRIRRPRRVWELRRPWRSGVLGRPWRSGVLGRPWRSGVLGRPWRIGELRWPWRVAPPKNFLGEAPHPRGALRSRGRRAGQGQRRENWAGRDQRS